MAKKAKRQPARSELLSAAELKRIRAEIRRRFGTAPTIAELKRGLAAAERRVEARLAARMAALDKRLQAFRKKAEKIAAETQLRMASDTLRFIRGWKPRWPRSPVTKPARKRTPRRGR